MKVGKKASTKVRGRNREATAVEKSIKSMIKKHGLELVRYVTTKIIKQEVEKVQLEREIKQKERELETLKKKK